VTVLHNRTLGPNSDQFVASLAAYGSVVTGEDLGSVPFIVNRVEFMWEYIYIYIYIYIYEAVQGVLLFTPVTYHYTNIIYCPIHCTNAPCRCRLCINTHTVLSSLH
jgi:hypothetical protein